MIHPDRAFGDTRHISRSAQLLGGGDLDHIQFPKPPLLGAHDGAITSVATNGTGERGWWD
jgi:hypothetical protein